MTWPTHYRYVDTIGPDGVTILEQTWKVVRESDRCYWIKRLGYSGVEARRVLKGAERSWAYPDKAKAWASYRARKRWQQHHARVALERASVALKATQVPFPDRFPHVCAGGEFFKQLNWEC